MLSSIVYAKGTEFALFIDKQGRVGIGSKTPRQKLDVVGKLRADSIEGDGAVPRGAIMMWSGTMSDIPAGWALCDGSRGTPDLRSRFIVAAGSGYAVGQSGEPDKLPPVLLNTAAAGTHPHKFPVNYYARNFLCGVAALGKDWCTGIDTHGPYQDQQETQSAGEHAHSLTVRFDEANAGQNRPRWYALAFIMKLRPKPDAGCVDFFDGKNQAGEVITFCGSGEHGFPSDPKGISWQYRVRSFRCGSGVENVTLINAKPSANPDACGDKKSFTCDVAGDLDRLDRCATQVDIQ